MRKCAAPETKDINHKMKSRDRNCLLLSWKFLKGNISAPQGMTHSEGFNTLTLPGADLPCHLL